MHSGLRTIIKALLLLGKSFTTVGWFSRAILFPWQVFWTFIQREINSFEVLAIMYRYL